MKHVTSADNPLLKTLRALNHDAGASRRLDKAWLEGAHLVAAALDRGYGPEALVLGEQALDQPEAAALAARVDPARIVCLPRNVFKAISGVEHGLQLGMLMQRPQPAPAGAGSAVVLDRIQDAGNVGTILRTAAAAGCGAVYCLRGTAGVWSPKVLRAGMGAHFALPVIEDAQWESIAPMLPRPVYATAASGAFELFELDLRQPVTWVFGNEGQGVSAQLLAACSAAVRIPQAGTMESLNVAAAAAVCLYEGLRQARLAPAPGATAPD